MYSQATIKEPLCWLNRNKAFSVREKALTTYQNTWGYTFHTSPAPGTARADGTKQMPWTPKRPAFCRATSGTWRSHITTRRKRTPPSPSTFFACSSPVRTVPLGFNVSRPGIEQSLAPAVESMQKIITNTSDSPPRAPD